MGARDADHSGIQKMSQTSENLIDEDVKKFLFTGSFLTA